MAFSFNCLQSKTKRVSLQQLPEKMKMLLIPALCMVCMNVANSYACRACGVTLTYVVKSTIPVWTVLWSLSQGERYPIMVCPALVLSCVGVATASAADFEFNIEGFSFAVISTIAQTAFNITSKSCMKKAGLASTEGFFVSCCICYLFLQTAFYVEAAFNPSAEHIFVPAQNAFQAGNTWPVTVLGLTTLSYFIEYQLNFGYVGMVSALTFAITDIVRRLVTIVFNSFLFDKVLTPMNQIGITTALGGALLYAIIMNRGTGSAPARSSKKISASKKKRSSSPAPVARTSNGREKSRSRSRSTSPPKRKISTTTTTGRAPDILDKLIGTLGEVGVIGIVVAGAAVYVGTYGVPEETGMVFCALSMGLGKGGVPGMSTLASAFFALLAPAGRVNQMMALVVPITMIADSVVGLAYMNDALWRVAMKLVVWTGFGILLGMPINNYMSDDLTRRLIGVLFLGVVMTMIYDKVVGSAKLSNEEREKKRQWLFSMKVLAPCGIIGGVASYITNNMGPMLNVYLLSLDLDKYALVGTRSAIFISVNAVKLSMRVFKGDLQCSDMPMACALGGVAAIGVVLAKIWLKNASPALFKFVYERVTLVVVSITGGLLLCGWDMSSLAKVCWQVAAPLVTHLFAPGTTSTITTTAIATTDTPDIATSAAAVSAGALLADS